MDILHFLKTSHDAIRAQLARLDAADGVKARRALLGDLGREVEVHLALEKDYLYPEIGELFAGAQALVAAGLASSSVINKRLKTVVKLIAKTASEQDGLDKRIDELRDSILRHFDQEEQILMPKMRSLIRTEDREDLGQLFVDVKGEVLAAQASGDDPSGRSRKRA